MNRKEYLKKYRENHIEKYREYQRKYRKNNLSSYDKLKLEKDSLIKYLENEINKCDIDIEETKKWLDEKELFNQVQNDLRVLKTTKKTYQDTLERIKNNNYE